MLIVAVGFGVFAFAVKNLTIFTETEAPETSGIGRVQFQEASLVQVPAPSYSSDVSIEH
jgi:hypothetical protein